MSLISIEHLLQPVSSDMPCGEDVSELTEYYVLEDLVSGTEPGAGMEGGTEARWPKVLDTATELFQHGKELRVAVHLVHALLCLDGFAGLRDGLQFIQRLLETYWDSLYPELDAEEERPETARMNVLRELSAGAVSGEAVGSFVAAVRETPFCNSRQIGAFTWRDVQLATGEIPVPEGTAVAQPALIEAAIKDTDPAAVTGTVQALEEAITIIGATDAFLSARLAAGNTAQLGKLGRLLTRILARLQSADGGSGTPAAAAVATGPSPAAEAVTVPTQQRAPTDIASHEDVVRALDAICAWYAAHEKSSPVPYLLKRAQRLVGRDFMAIVRDVAPGAEDQVKDLLGAKGANEEESA